MNIYEEFLDWLEKKKKNLADDDDDVSDCYANTLETSYCERNFRIFYNDHNKLYNYHLPTLWMICETQKEAAKNNESLWNHILDYDP